MAPVLVFIAPPFPSPLHVLVFAAGHPPALRYGATSHLPILWD
jgi:hypothetical protein